MNINRNNTNLAINIIPNTYLIIHRMNGYIEFSSVYRILGEIDNKNQYYPKLINSNDDITKDILIGYDENNVYTLMYFDSSELQRENPESNEILVDKIKDLLKIVNIEITHYGNKSVNIDNYNNYINTIYNISISNKRF